ncbi:APC family permease [Geodermatophilus poikilotrophus]|uniref:Amino acid transporter n=1 Tax=Geodermatophilus poikilotrophus TaxID=1333667 RepID=A0A1H9YVY6_9ACTN|nr:APC family permease [Geodermatophilus poikilotrophus]SES73320.1 Amino acid transporter [Geodermatophilus poikilotrophus]
MSQFATGSERDQTALAALQKTRLRRTLGRADIVLFIVAAVISIDTIGLMASGGGEGVVWATFLALAFLVPYALVFSETSAAFPAEGGPYHWVKLAFGRAWGAVAVVLYWITNPIWLGGSLAFIAAEAWSEYVVPTGEGGVGDYLFKLVFVWLAILLAIVSLKRGKRVINAGALAKLLVLLSMCLTAVVYAVQEGGGGGGLSFAPTAAGFLAIVPIALFAYVGFEAPSAASDEMHDAQRDTPAAIARGTVITLLAYIVPVLTIVLVTPADEMAEAGVMSTIETAYGVWGAAAGPLVTLTALGFVFALLTQGSAWMIATDRMQAVAAADGAFFGGYLGVFSERLGTPVRMNVLSGVVSTVFLLAAMTLVEGPAASVFAVVLTVAISTLLISYVIIVPAAIRLRLARPDVHRPYRVPGHRGVFVGLAALVMAFVTFGSWVAVFPGTIEPLLGIDYPFEEIWGVSRLNFELFTLGTLAVVIALGVAGYVGGARLRRTVPDRSAVPDDRVEVPQH